MDYITLNNGVKMPMAGIGVFMLTPDQAETAVESALSSGVRLIDTANGYMNRPLAKIRKCDKIGA